MEEWVCRTLLTSSLAERKSENQKGKSHVEKPSNAYDENAPGHDPLAHGADCARALAGILPDESRIVGRIVCVREGSGSRHPQGFDLRRERFFVRTVRVGLRELLHNRGSI